jgi:hypothetical protein
MPGYSLMSVVFRKGHPLFANRTRFSLVFSVVVSLFAAAFASAPVFSDPDPTVDLMMPIIGTSLYPISGSPVTMVVLDDWTKDRRGLSGKPDEAANRLLAQVVSIVSDAGAKVIALDFQFDATLDRSDLMRGFDEPLLEVLARTAEGGRLVVVARDRGPGVPIVAAVRQGNVGPWVSGHPWHVLYRTEILDPVSGRQTFPMRVADRQSGGRRPFREPVYTSFNRVSEIPVWSMGGVLDCSETDVGRASLSQRFSGKTVVIGSIDRSDVFRTPIRETALPIVAPARGCDAMVTTPIETGDGILPGVAIRAVEILTLLGKEPFVAISGLARTLIILSMTFVMMMIFVNLPYVTGFLATFVFTASIFVFGYIAIRGGFLIPLYYLLGLPLVSFLLSGIVRTVEDERRWFAEAHAFEVSSRVRMDGGVGVSTVGELERKST